MLDGRMVRNRLLVGSLVLMLSVFLSGCNSSPGTSAQGNQNGSKSVSFDGKTIHFLVGYGPGGGYDLYARMLAPYLQKYLPGSTVIVQNDPGAGSMKAVNELYQAKPDGTTIGIIDGLGMSIPQLGQDKNVKYDLTKFTWLGRLTADSLILVVNPKTPYKTESDLVNSAQQVKMDGQGVGSTPYVSGMFLSKALKLNSKMVLGSTGSSQSIMSVIQGTTDGLTISYDTLSPYIKNQQLRPIVQLDKNKEPDLPNVPQVSEFTADDESKAYAQAMLDMLEIGRSIAAPPGMSADVANAMRDAFNKAIQDPDFIATAKKSQRELKTLTGPEINQQVKKALQQPESVIALVKQVIK